MAAAAGDGKNPAAVGGGGGDDDGKNPAFRWINAARCTVALVVTVLIVSVIVNAIKFLARSDPLHISVVGGFVSTANLSLPPKRKLALDLNIRAQNPSGRARMYFVNITAYFFDGNTSSASASLDPEYDSMMFSKDFKDMGVPQQLAMDNSVHVKATKVTMPDYFDFLYRGGHMSGVTLRLDGNLSTEVLSGTKNETRPTNYYCENLLLGGDKDDEAFMGGPDVICSHEHPSSMTVHIEPMMMIQASWPFVFAILHCSSFLLA